MCKIVFDLNEVKKFLKNFNESIESRVAYGGRYVSEEVVYDVDDNGQIYSKRYINDELNDRRFEEFIQGQIIEN